MALLQIIKYEGDNQTFIWKHPIEDFYTGSQLIVHETQEAVFFMNGQVLDVFGPGKHTLETQNLPFLSRLFNRPFGGETPFHCEVYFVNLTEQMAMKWGTDSKVEYIEPTYNFPLQIGASGEMSLRPADSRKLLTKLIGTEIGITQIGLVQKFRGILMTKIKTYLANLVREEKINIFAIDEYLSKMSEELQTRLTPDFADYGLSLERFFVTTIVKPEDDQTYRRFKDLYFRQYADVAEAQLRQKVSMIDQQTQANRMVIEAQGIAQKRALEGYTYQQERSFDVAERIAGNENVAQFSNLGIGLGVMGGVGATVGGTLKNALGGMDQQPPQQCECPSCHAKLQQGAKFCFSCGAKIESIADDKMICPHCGKPTPKGKFCTECGGQLKTVCPQCGKELQSGSKFCPECGCKL